LTPYIGSLLRGEPAVDLVGQMPFVVRLHVFSVFAMLAVVPFTSFAMVLVSAGDRVVLIASHPVAATARGGRRVLAKLSPARWLGRKKICRRRWGRCTGTQLRTEKTHATIDHPRQPGHRGARRRDRRQAAVPHGNATGYARHNPLRSPTSCTPATTGALSVLPLWGTLEPPRRDSVVQRVHELP